MVAGAALAGWLLCAPVAAPASSPSGLFHSWQATARYGQSGGPVDDNAGLRIGYGQNDRFALGLRAGVGERGFARIEAGQSHRESKRADMGQRSAASGQFIGLSGGYVFSPLVSAGLSAQYGFSRGSDNYGALGPFLKTQNHTWRATPFVALSPPSVAGFDLSLMLSLSHMRSYTRYRPDAASIGFGREDIGKTTLRLADVGISRRLTPDLTLGASVTWTQITSQQTQGADLPAGKNAGSAGLSASYRINDTWRVSLDAGHDFKNDRGKSFNWGTGLSFLF